MYRVTSNLALRALLFSRPAIRQGQRGATLAELLVVLAIMSVLAVMALPVAETSLARHKEAELRQTLRDVRSALDHFHEDVLSGVVSPEKDVVSKDGYPVRLEVLVEGVAETDGGKMRKYLRKLPLNPFAPPDEGLEQQWQFIGYRDAPDAEVWGGDDIYDLRPITKRKGLDGSEIATW